MNEEALHDLLSGRRKDLGARFLRGGLGIASLGYSLAMRLRNLAYDRHLFRQHQVSVPVISVGNITTGGTGKTPVAAWLANWAKAEGRKPGLISRGYRALTGKVDRASSTSLPENDEKLVLDRLCPNVPHLQQRDRVSSARRAIEEFGCDLLLLDDGFQHRRLQRDLNLVLIDALKPWGYGHVLPRGLLRESLAGLKRADLILITRSNQCSPLERHELLEQLRRYRSVEDIVDVAFKPNRLVDLNWQTHPVAEVTGKKVLAFCGIGNPDGFRQTIVSLGVKLIEFQVFPDHHHYTDQELVKLASRCDADLILTTQKDLVKIRPELWQGPPLFAVEIGLEFLTGESLFRTRLQQVLNKSASTQRS